MADPVTKPSKADDVLLELTIGDLLFAMKTTQDTATSAPEYEEEVTRIPNIKKIAFKGNGKSTDIFASGKKFGTITQETSIEATLTHIGLPVSVIDKMKGVAAQHGVEFGSTMAKQMPEFALGFDTILSDGQHDAMWLTSVTIDPAVNDSHETSEDGFKEVNPDTVFNAGGLRNSNIYFARYNSARDSADMSVDDFLKQVIYDPSQLDTIADAGTDPNGNTPAPVAVTGVTLDKPTASVAVGATVQLTATVAPANADNKSVTFKSSDETVATVDNTGKVTGVKAGSADITATTTDGGKNAKSTVTVTAAE